RASSGNHSQIRTVSSPQRHPGEADDGRGAGVFGQRRVPGLSSCARSSRCESEGASVEMDIPRRFSDTSALWRTGANSCDFRGFMVREKEARGRLGEGNRRFVSSIGSKDVALTGTQRIELTKEQKPFAIILGCSDSRVPAEIVFDQGLGDLFVIR